MYRKYIYILFVTTQMTGDNRKTKCWVMKEGLLLSYVYFLGPCNNFATTLELYYDPLEVLDPQVTNHWATLFLILYMFNDGPG